MRVVDILTDFDVHQIAYLTMHGWTCYSDGEWSKEGFTRGVETSHPCGCCMKTHQTEYFDRDRAYWAQKDEE